MKGRLVKGTNVLTSRGYLPVEQVKKGDMLLTSTGRFDTVTNTHQLAFTTIIYKITTDGCSEPIICSPESEFLTTDNGFVTADKLRISDVFMVKLPIDVMPFKETIDLSEYIDLSKRGVKLAEDSITVGIRTEHMRSCRFLPVNDTVMYFFGLYAAHGAINNNNVRFGTGAGTKLYEFIIDFYKEYINAYGDYTAPRVETSISRSNTEFSAYPLKSFLEATFGRNLKEKRFPMEFLTMPISSREAFLNGMFSHRKTIRSMSMSLSYLIRDMAATLGKFVEVKKFEKLYELTLVTEDSDRIKDGHVIYPIYKIEKTYPRLTGYTFTLTTEDSFNIPIATHRI